MKKKIMKQFLLLAVGCMAMLPTQAQTPQYALTPFYSWDTLKPRQSPLRNFGNAVQTLYVQADFPGMPASGAITHFYLSIGTAADSGLLTYGYRIKMMQTDIDSFGPAPQAYDYPYAVSPQVFYESLFRMPQDIPRNGWLKVALQTPFSYDFTDAQRPNLMIEISSDSTPQAYQVNSATAYVNYYDRTSRSLIYSTVVLTPQQTVAIWGERPVIGFDITPSTAVGALSGIREERLLYPNPATETLHLSLSGAYKIYDMQGRLVKTGVNDPAKDIDISGLAKGLYQLNMVTEQNTNLHQRFIKN